METKTLYVSDKRRAYFATLDDTTGKYVLAIVTENEPGYNSVKEDSDAGGPWACKGDAQSAANLFNERLGLTPREAALIVASSIRVSDVQVDESTLRRRPKRGRKV